jgi:N-methylhydantoinase B/oxoprolinase/acetone carboxylase alpha subunit
VDSFAGREHTRQHAAMSDIKDPIAFELFKNAIFSIADEMALTVFRTTYSGVLKDNMDYSTGFADADGKLVAQGLTLPGHLGSVPTAMESIMRHYGDDMVEGDVFIMNDPFDGGMHLPDIFIFKPLYHEGRRMAFACTVCHHTDVGGRVAGSNASDSTEIYAEGLRIAPLKLYEAGAPSENYLNPQTENRVLPGKFTMTVKKGDIFRHVLAGAGGWGDPLDRDPVAVMKDVRNELLSTAKAVADYGVVIDTAKWSIDLTATAKARADIKRARGWTETPKVQWQDPPGVNKTAVRAAE